MISMQRLKINDQKTLIEYRQICSEAYFVVTGSLGIYAYDIVSNESFKFCIINKGGWVNLANMILGHESLFRVVAEEGSELMYLTSARLKHLDRNLQEVHLLTSNLRKSKNICGVKYDFARFTNLKRQKISNIKIRYR
jgi:hypothetical protein